MPSMLGFRLIEKKGVHQEANAESLAYDRPRVQNPENFRLRSDSRASQFSNLVIWNALIARRPIESEDPR